MSDIKPGDIVYLKSGGPPMTAGEEVFMSSGAKIECQWFEGKKLEKGYFTSQQLTNQKPKVDIPV